MRIHALISAILVSLVCCSPPLLVTAPVTGPIERVGVFVAPHGTSHGDGSPERPLDLATALSGRSIVQPGDTIWLRGGSYRGTFISDLSGAPDAPIVVRQYPGERAVLNRNGNTGTVLMIRGGYATYWGFEVTDSLRTGLATQGTGVEVHGTGVRLVNLIIHDIGGSGLGCSSSAVGGEVYGSLIYNNGYEGSDRGHGHGIYSQNKTGTKRIVDNIIFNQFGFGIHVYGSSAAFLTGYDIRGNVVFNNGVLSTGGASPNLLVGGEAPADRITIADNVIYRSPGMAGVNAMVGYLASAPNGDLRFERNRLVGSEEGASIKFWSTAHVRENVIEAPRLVSILGAVSGYSWAANTYRSNPVTGRWVFGGTGYAWEAWRQASGLGSSDAVEPPTQAIEVIVRPNLYESGRANVVVLNKGGLPDVAVDLSQVLRRGEHFEVRDAQNYFGDVVLSTTYQGSPVTLPLAARTPGVPIGTVRNPPPMTGPNFHVFIVSRLP